MKPLSLKFLTRATSLALLTLVLAPVSAQAITVSFSDISHNNSSNAATGEKQLTATVTDGGSNTVLFRFLNSGPQQSSITDVYLDWNGPTFLSLKTLNYQNVGEVAFSTPAAPPDLPSGDSITPKFDATFSADSNRPVSKEGVNPGESLGILFNLLDGFTFIGVEDAISKGTLRLGLHVQDFANGGSESFVNLPPDCQTCTVPEPASVSLLGLALTGLGLFGRRRKT